MIIKTSIGVIFLIFINGLMFGQTPGYMGKRTVAGYGIHGSPVVISSVSGASKNSFNVLHDFFIERAMNKRFSLALSIKYYETLYDNSGSLIVPESSGGYYSMYNGYHPSNEYEISGLNFCFSGKKFFGRYIAPWGKYFSFGVNIKRITAKYNPQYMKVLVSEPTRTYPYTNVTKYYNSFGPLEQSFTDIDLMAGIGMARVLSDKIVLDYGYNFNLFAFAATLFDGGDELITTRTMSNYIEKTSKQRVRGVNRFNLYLKLGVLF